MRLAGREIESRKCPTPFFEMYFDCFVNFIRISEYNYQNINPYLIGRGIYVFVNFSKSLFLFIANVSIVSV